MIAIAIIFAVVYIQIFIVLIFMKASLITGIFTFALVTWVVSMVVAFFGIISLLQRKKAGVCTVHTIGTLLASHSSRRAGRSHEFLYLTEDGERKGKVSDDYVEHVEFGVVGKLYDVWYNPKRPEEFIVSVDGQLSSIQKDYKLYGLVGLFINLISAAVLLTLFMLKL